MLQGDEEMLDLRNPPHSYDDNYEVGFDCLSRKMMLLTMSDGLFRLAISIVSFYLFQSVADASYQKVYIYAALVWLFWYCMIVMCEKFLVSGHLVCSYQGWPCYASICKDFASKCQYYEGGWLGEGDQFDFSWYECCVGQVFISSHDVNGTDSDCRGCCDSRGESWVASDGRGGLYGALTNCFASMTGSSSSSCMGGSWPLRRWSRPWERNSFRITWDWDWGVLWCRQLANG